MADDDGQPAPPDLTQGIAARDIPAGGVFLGQVGDDRILLARREGEIVAVSADCTHYQAPLENGLRHGETIRCPWHHACFSLRTGAALEAPALTPLARWDVETDGETVRVSRPRAAEARRKGRPADPQNIVIVGGGAAGFGAAQRLRDLGFGGKLTLISDDTFAPYDRPNLSKEYLRGEAEADWMPLKSESFYQDEGIDLRLGVRATALNIQDQRVELEIGDSLAYDRLLLATGAKAKHPDIPGLDPSDTHVLRSQADADRLIAAAQRARSVAILGASFIGLEVAASLRERGLEVQVIAPDNVPFETRLGPELGAFIRRLHVHEGVIFHLGRTAKGYGPGGLILDNDELVSVDFIVAGIGVTPRLELAEAAGLAMDRGVIVDNRLRTSAPHVFAAGDIARYPDCVSGDSIRVEHWVAAERQGQVAAANMLELDTPFREPPFFWTAFYGLGLHYVGHAESWDRIEIVGDLEGRAAVLNYIKGNATKAVVSVGPEEATLKAAQAFRDSCRRN